MAHSVADQMVESLVAAGVTRIYGIVGDSLNALTDSLRRSGEIEWLHVRHEEVAAFAAGADATVSGGLAVCAGSCGPGNLHLINGLYDCHRSRVPVLAIAAQIPTAEIGSGYFQETHPELLFRECSSYCELVSNPEQMPRLLHTAIRRAVSERCVCVLVVPGDIAMSAAVPSAPPRALLPREPLIVPDGASLDVLAEMLNSGKAITLLCGAGCDGARDELLALGRTLQAPMVHTLRGKEVVEPDNPFDVGMTGLIGFASGYYAMNACDVLLMLGTDFPYRQFYPKKARIAQVDVRAESLGKRAPIELGLLGQVRETLRQLLPRLKAKTDDRHLKLCRKKYKDAREGLDHLATGSANGPLHPQYVTRVINDEATDDAVFTCDVGLPTVWAARYLTMGRRRLVGSFVHGSMANALAQAIGVQAVNRKRRTIALCGDGGFTMLMGDLLTLVQLELAVKVNVYNNGSLGFVELEQKTAGLLTAGTTLQNPDFAAMANAVGIKGIRVTDPSQLKESIKEAFAYPGPVLVDAVVSRMELVMPPNISLETAKGFTLYMAKAVMSGRGDEVLDLAKTNLNR